MKRIFQVIGNGKGRISIYIRKKAKKGSPSCDLIDVYGKNTEGKVFIDCGINKEEAIWLSEGLLRAFNILNIEEINKSEGKK